VSSLAEAFRSGNGRKTKWQGKQVHSLFQLNVKDGDSLLVTRVSASPLRAQALKLATDKGGLRANGVVVSPMAIWTHTSPEQLSIQVVGRKIRSLDIWNGWSFDGVDSSWLGNAGMIIETWGDVHTLRCSDGIGEPTFDDLVMTVTVQHG